MKRVKILKKKEIRKGCLIFREANEPYFSTYLFVISEPTESDGEVCFRAMAMSSSGLYSKTEKRAVPQSFYFPWTEGEGSSDGNNLFLLGT